MCTSSSQQPYRVYHNCRVTEFADAGIAQGFVVLRCIEAPFHAPCFESGWTHCVFISCGSLSVTRTEFILLILPFLQIMPLNPSLYAISPQLMSENIARLNLLPRSMQPLSVWTFWKTDFSEARMKTQCIRLRDTSYIECTIGPDRWSVYTRNKGSGPSC